MRTTTKFCMKYGDSISYVFNNHSEGPLLRLPGYFTSGMQTHNQSHLRFAGNGEHPILFVTSEI